MGYTTEFRGTFELSRPLSREEHTELERFSETRHDDEMMPGIWCDWAPTRDGRGIEWNGSAKFYDYVGWLEFIMDHFLDEWGITLSGTVKYRGEDFDDAGTITVEDGKVTQNSW